MGTTTFNGPVRSEDGFNQISKNASTGEVTTNFSVGKSGNISTAGTLTARRKVDNTTFNQSGGATATLTRAQSGTIFEVDGTDNNTVNLPALSVKNVGVTYEFFVTTAIGGSVTTKFVLPGSSVSNFYGAISLMGGSAANPASDVAGDTLTLVSNTDINARCTLTCISDNGENASIWKAEVLASETATID